MIGSRSIRSNRLSPVPFLKTILIRQPLHILPRRRLRAPNVENDPISFKIKLVRIYYNFQYPHILKIFRAKLLTSFILNCLLLHSLLLIRAGPAY